MSTTTIRQYIHRPNITELGKGNTHETYMLVRSDFDLATIFPPSITVGIIDEASNRRYTVKSANANGKEFRINQMGEIYRDYDVMPGDEIIITQIEKDGEKNVYLNVNKYNRVVLSVGSNGSEICNIERLAPYQVGDNQFNVSVLNKDTEQTLAVSFRESRKKRNDSPNETDYYDVSIDGETPKNGTYYLTLADKITICSIEKSSFNVVTLYENQEQPLVAATTPQHYQLIFYGAPGTGKSFSIDKMTTGEDAIRTTFHPDSDYSTFVGAYKPTTTEEPVMTVIGTKAVQVENPDGSPRKEAKIVYEFVNQAFLNAYIGAWKKYCAAVDGSEPQRQFLVIEEINRGNCAQIFGDLFQLLDRNQWGFSDYPITADADMRRQLAKALSGLTIVDPEGLNAMYKGRDVAGEVLHGEILLLPSNLYIWATMNTSDQSLFPIDSAFKRRWDWQYVPISDAGKGWQIEVGGDRYDWWQFLQKINALIGSTTNSEDKKLGYFFCKAADGGTITAEAFVGKVVFYLWNDVFKDYEFSDAKFNDTDGTKLTFNKFYAATADGATEVVLEPIKRFLANLEVSPIATEPDGDNKASTDDSFQNGNSRE